MARTSFLSRRGLSLMEVIFAIGVLLTGMVGLAALLPVASDNALEALNTSRSLELESNQAVMTEIQVVNQLSGAPSGFFGRSSETVFQSVEQEPYPDLTAFPDYFCVDPWFLTASGVIRDDLGATDRNAYDRTLFPCYDDTYNPINSPAADIETAPVGWSANPGAPYTPVLDEINTGDISLRRLPRISLSNVRSGAYHEANSRDRDSVEVVLDPDGDRSKAAGLFVKRTRSGERSSTNLAGRFSYLVTVDNTAATPRGQIVTFRDRQVVPDPGAAYYDRHNLGVYAAAPAADENIPLINRTFAEERLGYVTYAEDVIRRGRGTFTYDLSLFVDPEVRVGDWLMLIRRQYDPATSAIRSNIDLVDPGELRFAWFQIVSIEDGPRIDDGPYGSAYRTEVTVDDAGAGTGTWIFHPIQAFGGSSAGAYPSSAGSPTPEGYNGGQLYDAANVNGSGSNLGHTGVLGDPLYGTQVVLMRNVIRVDNF